MKFTSPRHLHKALSGANEASLEVVPVCIAECRSVRVIRVLEASRKLLVLVCVGCSGYGPPKEWATEIESA